MDVQVRSETTGDAWSTWEVIRVITDTFSRVDLTDDDYETFQFVHSAIIPCLESIFEYKLRLSDSRAILCRTLVFELLKVHSSHFESVSHTTASRACLSEIVVS